MFKGCFRLEEKILVSNEALNDELSCQNDLASRKEPARFFVCAVALIAVVAGYACGSAAAGTSTSIADAVQMLFRFRGDDFAQLFLVNLIVQEVYLVLSILLGYSAFGWAVQPFLLFFRSLGMGAAVTVLTASQGLRGAGYAVIGVVPGMVLTTAVLIAASSNSMALSFEFSRFARGGERGVQKYTRFEQARRISLYIISMCAAVSFDALINMFINLIF